MSEQAAHSRIAGLLIAIILLYAGVLIGAPVVTILAGAFAKGVPPVLAALTAPGALAALRLTFILTALAAAFNTIFGVLVAWVLVRHEFPGKALFNGLVDLPFVISPVIVGFVILVLFGRGGWFGTLPFQVAFAFPGLLLVTVFVSLPFVIREVMPVLASLTPEQEEAALTLGAGRLTVFRRIIFPGIRHAVIYGLVLTLARALGEFGAAAVAGGAIQGLTETVTLYVYRTIQNNDDVSAYSMAILLGLISIAVLMTMNLLRRSAAGRDTSHVDLAE